MRIDVLINPRAGYAKPERIESELKAALFRCDLRFHHPTRLSETDDAIREAIQGGCEYLVVCGGDGTLNTTLKPLVEIREETGVTLPGLCIIPVGTANDLAREMKISKRIDKTARAILEGGSKLIDVLEITGDGKRAYMITNGGIGVPAQTALTANQFRQWVKSRAEDDRAGPAAKTFFKIGKRLIEMAGSKIYELILINEVTNWDHSDWKVEIDVPGKTSFSTRASFILVNNQPSVGGSFKPAPFTSNGDGTFNVLLIEPNKLLQQTRVILDIRRGRIPQVGDCLGFETERVSFRTTDKSRLFTFFGDGEILHKSVSEISVRCIHPGIPLVTMET